MFTLWLILQHFILLFHFYRNWYSQLILKSFDSFSGIRTWNVAHTNRWVLWGFYIIWKKKKKSSLILWIYFIFPNKATEKKKSCSSKHEVSCLSCSIKPVDLLKGRCLSWINISQEWWHQPQSRSLAYALSHGSRMASKIFFFFPVLPWFPLI